MVYYKKSNMEKDKVVLCRPFYCDDCYKSNRVIEGKIFAIYGTDRASIFIRKANWHGVRGITPHLIFFDGVIKDNLYEIIVACGIHGCGIKLYEIPDNPGSYDVDIKNARLYHLSKKDFEALKNFKDNDYKIG